MMRTVKRFLTAGNGGRKVWVIELRHYHDTGNFEGSGEVEGITYLRTESGQPLNRRSDTELEVRLTGEILRPVPR
jgi:hypothetical protein